jgi:hypothetical protein
MSSATFMRDKDGNWVEHDIVDGKVVPVPDRVRCPDCGEIVDGFFDHIAGCPPEVD